MLEESQLEVLDKSSENVPGSITGRSRIPERLSWMIPLKILEGISEEMSRIPGDIIEGISREILQGITGRISTRTIRATP